MTRALGLACAAAIVGAALWPPAADPEAGRLRRHFAEVLVELRGRDVSHLTASQREARQVHVARLEAYAARGVFPQNRDFDDRRMPYFIDRRGTRCAMAHLIEQSGSGAYVLRVAATINKAYVAEIARDAELGGPLAAWLDANGLTAAEAARIQPAYDPCQFNCPPPERRDPPAVPTSYKAASAGAIVGGISTAALNVALLSRGGAGRTAGWLGAASGALGVGLALGALDQGDEYSTLRLVNGGIGAIALVVGLNAVSRAKAGEPEPRFAAAPWTGRDGASGVLLSVRF
jgi:hypothetical protein